MGRYRIAVIAGDGIGPEVVAEAVKVLGVLESPELAFELEVVEAGAGCYRRTGDELPGETLEVCQAADAILFGSAGLPDVRLPDVTEIAPQLTLRVCLDLYQGLRPIKLYPASPAPSGSLRGRESTT
jgi:3-isopropylmalate dehydrogenase